MDRWKFSEDEVRKLCSLGWKKEFNGFKTLCAFSKNVGHVKLWLHIASYSLKETEKNCRVFCLGFDFEYGSLWDRGLELSFNGDGEYPEQFGLKVEFTDLCKLDYYVLLAADRFCRDLEYIRKIMREDIEKYELSRNLE